MTGWNMLLYKEVLRFWRVAFQTVAGPVLTAMLYLLIFGHALEAQSRAAFAGDHDEFTWCNGIYVASRGARPPVGEGVRVGAVERDHLHLECHGADPRAAGRQGRLRLA